MSTAAFTVHAAGRSDPWIRAATSDTEVLVDDTTVTEFLNKPHITCMQAYFDELVEQST